MSGVERIKTFGLKIAEIEGRIRCYFFLSGEEPAAMVLEFNPLGGVRKRGRWSLQ